jgi:HK97 family phage portal protein
MNLRGLISRVPLVGGAIAKSMGWQSAMFGDLLDGGGAAGNAALTRPYGKSAWVRSAIGHVAGPISMRPLVITQDRRGGDVVIDNPDLTRFWEKPARTGAGRMNRQELIEATVVLLKLKGQCFWIMDDTWLAPRTRKTPLILARHDAMHAVMSGRELLGWIWTDAAGRQNQLIPEQVIHHKFWNPYHEVLGLSEWESAMIASESDYSAGVFAKNLAKNNGDRGPYVIGRSGQFTDPQIEQITAQLRQKRELGRRGDFRAAFLPGDVDVKEAGVSSVDSEFVTQRLENRKEVYIAFGVPPSYADPQASYSIGSASDRFRLIEDTCMPLASKIADGMETVSALFLGTRETVFVEFEWDSHSTMQSVRAERFETATKAVSMGMPWVQASEYFRLKLPRFPGDAVGRIPFNLTEIEADGNLPPEPAPEPAPPEDDLERLFAERSQRGCGCGAGCGANTKIKADIKVNPKWEKLHAYRKPWEKKFQTRVSRFLMDARAETLRNIAAMEKAEKAGVEKKNLLEALNLVFDLAAWLPKWTAGLLEVSRNAMETAGFEVWTEELGKDDPLTQPAAEVLEALTRRENRLAGAGQQVWDAVVTDLDQGLQRGETMDELADRVRRKFQGIDKARGLVIAKTETTFAYETARAMAFRDAGAQWKQWLTSGLGNERLSHLGANEQIVPADEKFLVGGFEMLHPGDPDAPAKEVINCNCVMIAVSGPDGSDIEGNEGEEIPY